jgi:iron complex transport system ATP-binding protein
MKSWAGCASADDEALSHCSGEPCAGMDPGARENFLATLQAVGKHKRICSLIYVTHHVEEILPFFGKTLVLKQGKVLYSGATRAVLKPDVLRELYGVSADH